MPEPDLIDPSEPLARQNARLKKIAAALMNRVERDTAEAGNAYSLFQRAISLEDEVRARTRDLQRTLDELNLANQKLEAASAVAEQANRAKSRFVAAASHDVRQPLNAANLFLSSLAETGLDPRQLRILGQVASALSSVEGILGSLLNISQLDSSSTRAEVTDFPVASVLGPLADEFRPVALQRELNFRTVIPSLWIRSDPYYLRQIIQNLLSNALRYTRAGGVLLGCRRAGAELRIQVHDTGPGIAKEDLPVIFEEFRRLPIVGELPGRTDGVGLGLAIVRRATTLLEHRLDVRSRPGHGTSFTIAVPVFEASPGNDARDPVAGESAETLIVLIIAAEGAPTAPVAAMLDQWGANGVTARSLDEANAVIETLGIFPDAVLVHSEIIDRKNAPAIADLSRQTGNVTLLTGRGRVTDLPAPLAALPRLAFPVQPHRLRAILFR